MSVTDFSTSWNILSLEDGSISLKYLKLFVLLWLRFFFDFGDPERFNSGF